MTLADSDHIKELFSGFGPVGVRRMFGGAGIFYSGLMIGLISGGEIYLKVDVQTVPAFDAEGMKPFTYGAKSRRVVMSYWRMPERLLDAPDELAQWARAAFGAAERTATKRNGKPGQTEGPRARKRSRSGRKS